MNQIDRSQSGTMQLWSGMPIWAKVITAIVLGIVFYYSFAILFSLFIVAALGIGTFTMVRWFFQRR